MTAIETYTVGKYFLSRPHLQQQQPEKFELVKKCIAKYEASPYFMHLLNSQAKPLDALEIIQRVFETE